MHGAAAGGALTMTAAAIEYCRIHTTMTGHATIDDRMTTTGIRVTGAGIEEGIAVGTTTTTEVRPSRTGFACFAHGVNDSGAS